MLDLSSYIPESFAPQYQWLRETVVEWMRTLGIIPGVVTDADGTRSSPSPYSDFVPLLQKPAKHVLHTMMRRPSIIQPKKGSVMMKTSWRNSSIPKALAQKVNGRSYRDYVYPRILESVYLCGLIYLNHPLILLSLRYTYEVCLFGDATQKSGAHHSLGYVAFASIHEQALTGFQQIFVVEYRP